MEKCPTCGRAKKKALTPEQEYERVVAKANASLNRSLRKPMPPKTLYKDD